MRTGSVLALDREPASNFSHGRDSVHPGLPLRDMTARNAGLAKLALLAQYLRSIAGVEVHIGLID